MYKAWIHAGNCNDVELSREIFELNMCNLTWTQIPMAQAARDSHGRWLLCSVSAISESKLIFHYTTGLTWILDLSSPSWKKYEASQDHPRHHKHSSTIGLNSSVVKIHAFQDTRYKMVLLPFHVYNYTHIRRYSRRDMHSI